jgi:hypothetical protein
MDVYRMTIYVDDKFWITSAICLPAGLMELDEYSETRVTIESGHTLNLRLQKVSNVPDTPRT